MRIPFPLVAIVVLGCSATEPGGGGRERPNIVLVMTDDQGYGDFGYAGNPVLETPNLDALAASSPRVERFYVSPVCSPTRASLMTGRYNYRTRVVDTYRGRSMMEPDEVTLAEILHEAGYRTGVFGKWHLGDDFPMRPIDQGFDEALVHRGGGLAQPSEPIENARRYTDPVLIHNGVPVETSGYCTDVYFEAALEFVDRSREEGRPFFAYVAPNAPHDPYHDVPAELLAKYAALDLAPAGKGDDPDLDRIARTFAMIENIDQNMGRLLEHLAEAGLEENTLVVFLCDNGPVGGRYVNGLRGAKGGVYEGGIRSPLFVRMGGRLSPETRVEVVAAHIDLLPTLLDAVDVSVPAGLALDGRSLWPLLEGRAVEWPERSVVIQSHRGDAPVAEHHFALVGPRWKLVRASGFGRDEPEGPEVPFELFDLPADPGEEADLAGANPDVVARLRAEYAAWFEDVGTTRPDNYAPPRIVVDARAEPVALLTRQDWRLGPGGGWGDDGVWLLDFARDTTFDVRVLFKGRQTVSAVTVGLGPDAPVPCPIVETHAGDDQSWVTLATLTAEAGPADLRIRCTGPDGADFGPYQVELIPR